LISLAKHSVELSTHINIQGWCLKTSRDITNNRLDSTSTQKGGKKIPTSMYEAFNRSWEINICEVINKSIKNLFWRKLRGD
jgi:hypothetical protein